MNLFFVFVIEKERYLEEFSSLQLHLTIGHVIGNVKYLITKKKYAVSFPFGFFQIEHIV